eukprot:COSAG02_NODE_9149_length_2309_cov_1.428959_1_plen_263_part_10
MLRVSGSFGHGRALAWLGKIMREMNLRDQHSQNDKLPAFTGAVQATFANGAVVPVPDRGLVATGLSNHTDILDTDDTGTTSRTRNRNRGRRRRKQRTHNRKAGRRSTSTQQQEHEQPTTQSKTNAHRGTGTVSAPPMHDGHRASALPAQLPNRSTTSASHRVGQGTTHLPPLEPMAISPGIVRSLALRTTLDFELRSQPSKEHKSAPAVRARERHGLEPLPWETRAAGMLQLDATSRFNVRAKTTPVPRSLSKSTFRPSNFH